MLRLTALLLGWIGTITFAASVLFVALVLAAGVTRRAGEGDVLPPEAPEQTASRLQGLGVALGVAALAWTAVRLGEFLRQPEPRTWRLRPVVAEVFLFLGGAGLGSALLIVGNIHAARFAIASPYRMVALLGGMGGAIALGIGWLLSGRAAGERPADPATPRVSS